MKIKDIELGKPYAHDSGRDWERYTSGKEIIVLEAGWNQPSRYGWGTTPTRGGGTNLLALYHHGADEKPVSAKEAAKYSADEAELYYHWHRQNRMIAAAGENPHQPPRGWRLITVTPAGVRCTWEEYQDVIKRAKDEWDASEKARKLADAKRREDAEWINSLLKEFGIQVQASSGRVEFTREQLEEFVTSVQNAAWESAGEPE